MDTTIRCIPLLLLPLLAACSESDPVTELPHYIGQSRSSVVARLGDPDHIERFAMKDAAGEFRVGLQNTYPLTDAANAGVEIEELWWDDEQYWITLWFHKVDGEWVVLDTCRWRKDIVF